MATARPRPQVMRLTDAAAERIKDVMANADKPVAGVRVGVKNGGCAGMAYTMEYAEAVAPLDEVVEDKGVQLLIDPKAVLFLLGTEMDYKAEKLSAQFVFNNPNQTSACGCGESVQLTPAADPAHADAHYAPWTRERVRDARLDARIRSSNLLLDGLPGQRRQYTAESGHLLLGRRDFRVGLADHAVAAVALGGIEAGVGALDQRLRGVALAQRRDADRDRDAAEVLAGRALHQFLGHHGAADVVGDRERRAQRACSAARWRIPRRRSAPRCPGP